MGDSTRISVNDTGWTNISGGATGGFISNQGNSTIIYAEGATASPPADSDAKGHSLVPNDNISFILVAGQDVYARSTNGTSELEFTAQ